MNALLDLIEKDPQLKFKPFKAEAKSGIVKEYARAPKGFLRFRISFGFAKLPKGEEHVPGKCPEFYGDCYVVAKSEEEALEIVMEHYKISEDDYTLSVLELED